MDQPYSFLADWLSKFHMASKPLQALWIVALAATVLGAIGIVMRGVVEIARITRRTNREWSEAYGQPSAQVTPAAVIKVSPVMPGPDPGTHALTHAAQERRGWLGQARP